MPQMAPLNWLTLFLFFLLIFLIYNIVNFFVFNYTPKQTTYTKSLLKYNWKW